MSETFKKIVGELHGDEKFKEKSGEPSSKFSNFNEMLKTTFPGIRKRTYEDNPFVFVGEVPSPGNPKPHSINDYRKMANAMVRGGGNYPSGMSPCFIAGINGDQEDTGGICPIWLQDKSECTCPDDCKVEYELLTKQEVDTLLGEKG